MTEQELRDRLKASMRERDTVAIKVLRGVLAGVKNRLIETKSDELPEADITAILKRESKQYGEALDFARKSGRAEVIEEEERAVAFAASLLPAQMSDAELKAAIEAIVSETGADSIGPVMKELGARHAGLYDGKAASALVRELLAAK